MILLTFTSLLFVLPGLLVYFGYGIWHSKEGLRELQPKDMAARYVVLPSGSLVETVQSVQPEGHADMAHHTSPSSDSTVEESIEKRWYVNQYISVALPLLHFITWVFHPTTLYLLLYASTPQGAMHALYLLWSILVCLVLLECKLRALLLLCYCFLGFFFQNMTKLSFGKWESWHRPLNSSALKVNVKILTKTSVFFRSLHLWLQHGFIMYLFYPTG